MSSDAGYWMVDGHKVLTKIANINSFYDVSWEDRIRISAPALYCQIHHWVRERSQVEVWLTESDPIYVNIFVRHVDNTDYLMEACYYITYEEFCEFMNYCEPVAEFNLDWRTCGF